MCFVFCCVLLRECTPWSPSKVVFPVKGLSVLHFPTLFDDFVSRKVRGKRETLCRSVAGILAVWFQIVFLLYVFVVSFLTASFFPILVLIFLFWSSTCFEIMSISFVRVHDGWYSLQSVWEAMNLLLVASSLAIWSDIISTAIPISRHELGCNALIGYFVVTGNSEKGISEIVVLSKERGFTLQICTFIPLSTHSFIVFCICTTKWAGNRRGHSFVVL